MTRAAITYRDVAPGDFAALHGLVSIWEVTRNLGSWPWPADEAFTRKRCVPFDGDGFVWAICDADHLIGTVSVVRGELGYMLHPDYHGQGIVQTAVQRALAYAFEHQNAQEVHADIWADNLASRHILLKFGFSLAVQEVDHALARDEPTDSETYKLPCATWSARTPPRLETDRLVLRPLRRNDADAIIRIAGDFEVAKWTSSIPNPYSHVDFDAFLAKVETGVLGYVWAIECRSEPVGLVSIGQELGYILARKAWGRGIMTEAGQAAVDDYFRGGEDDALLSSYFLGNDGSRRVLEKLGFSDAGPSTSFSEARGANVASHQMELTRTAWSALKQARE